MVLDNLQIFDHALNKIVMCTNYGSSHEIIELAPENLFRMDNPLRRNSVGYSKPMIRTKFLREHKINYWGKYRDNEDFILLSEIVISGAKTFIIPGAYYIYVHQVSPTTRKVSPYSRSIGNTALLVAQACDELMEKYKSALSAKAWFALRHRKKIFLTSAIAIEQKKLLSEGQYSKGVGLFFKYPSLVVYRVIGFLNRLGDTFRLTT
jgi:hypothetical protein